MRRTLNLIALIGLLFGLLPPATCLGIGQACCCAAAHAKRGAQSTTLATTTSRTALSEAGSSCACASCPEMSACPTDPPPATRAASPTSLAALGDAAPPFSARTALPNACAPLAAYHGADPDPPPAARLTHLSCLRI